MRPVSAAENWGVPAIESIGALAEWFGLTLSELLWFADLKGFGYRSNRPKLRHYHYRILDKRDGNIRLIEAPKPRLKELQRQILVRILEKIPPHPSVHGFVKERSIKTFVAPHASQRVILRMDLREFFPSFPAARIQTLFRTVGYPEHVADLLGGICTNGVPRDVWNKPAFDVDPCRWGEARTLYSKPHLPQGAPTSPALASLCAYRMDCRLSGLSKSVDAEYTRYADDLAFSGNEAFERLIVRFATPASWDESEGVTVTRDSDGLHLHQVRVLREKELRSKEHLLKVAGDNPGWADFLCGVKQLQSLKSRKHDPIIWERIAPTFGCDPKRRIPHEHLEGYLLPSLAVALEGTRMIFWFTKPDKQGNRELRNSLSRQKNGQRRTLATGSRYSHLRQLWRDLCSGTA
jgi:hypothetical protein